VDDVQRRLDLGVLRDVDEVAVQVERGVQGGEGVLVHLGEPTEVLGDHGAPFLRGFTEAGDGRALRHRGEVRERGHDGAVDEHQPGGVYAGDGERREVVGGERRGAVALDEGVLVLEGGAEVGGFRVGSPRRSKWSRASRRFSAKGRGAPSPEKARSNS